MQKSNWICIDIDYARFRREAPEKGSNVFELAQVNAYGDTYCVAHGFVYLDMDVNECKREMLIIVMNFQACWQRHSLKCLRLNMTLTMYMTLLRERQRRWANSLV